jgi:hypothetical protein
MDFKTKRQYKKRAKVFAYISILFVLTTITNFTLLLTDVIDRSIIRNNGIKGGLIVAGLLLLPIVLGIVSNFTSMMYGNTLSQYKSRIREWRKRKMFIRILDLVEVNDLPEAIRLYNTLRTGLEKDYLFMHLVTTFLHSDDEKRKLTGQEKMNDIRKSFDYNNIEFNVTK